jgi:hypothetical protein
VFGVAGVGGSDEGSSSGAGEEGPVVVGLEVVVVGAEGFELVELGVFGFGPLRVVIVLEVAGAVAAECGALW